MAAPGCRTAWEPHCGNNDVVLWLAPTNALLCGTDCSNQWLKYSISSIHNRLLPPAFGAELRFTAEVNSTRHQTSSYTSMYPISTDSALLLYNLATPGLCPYNLTRKDCQQTSGVSSLWAMKVTLRSNH